MYRIDECSEEQINCYMTEDVDLVLIMACFVCEHRL